MNARAADPSMEEILASIRRIIADDLPPRREPRSEPPASPDTARAEPDEAPALDRFEPQENEPPPIAAAPSRRAPEPSLMAAADLPLPDPVRRLVDLAAVEDEVQAEVAMALRGSIGGEAQPAAAPRPASPGAAPSMGPTPAASTEAPRAAALAPATAFGANLASGMPASSAQTAGAAPAGPSAPPLPARPSFNFGQPARAPAPPPRPEPDRLVSGPTNAAVAASFGTLARTVTPNGGRSLEDLVAELLKPMLRNWLDDHLPAIVERLVKAEIERVSRGGR